jgi:hypothetical protein
MNRSNKVSDRSRRLAVVAAIPILLAAVGANAQVGPDMRHINNTDGILIVSDVEGNCFRMQIKGGDVSRLRTTKKYWYTADSVRFEFFSEESAKFVMMDVPKLDDRIVLQLYRSDFLRRFADEKPKLRSSWLKLANNKTALLWIDETHPAAPQPITEKQIFIVVAGPMHVFGLFAPVPPGQTESQVRRVLVRTLGSLKLGDDSET